jgi:hypothetical protein
MCYGVFKSLDDREAYERFFLKLTAAVEYEIYVPNLEYEIYVPYLKYGYMGYAYRYIFFIPMKKYCIKNQPRTRVRMHKFTPKSILVNYLYIDTVPIYHIIIYIYIYII